MAVPLNLRTWLMLARSATAPKEPTWDQLHRLVSSRGFFNPRADRWTEHFRLETATIHPLTLIGEVTARILSFNDSARLHEREELIRLGTYPSGGAENS